MNYLNTADRCG